jgi:hypothetical protein
MRLAVCARNDFRGNIRAVLGLEKGNRLLVWALLVGGVFGAPDEMNRLLLPASDVQIVFFPNKVTAF